MQNQPVVGILEERPGDPLHQAVLYLAHGSPGGDADPVTDPEDVGVHRDHGFTECGVEDHVRGFPPDAGQRLQGLAGLRDLPAVLLDQYAAGGDDVGGLAVMQADGADVGFEAGDAECQDGFRRARASKQFPRRLVDRDVRALGGQDDGDEQFERIAVTQFGGRLRAQFLEAAKNPRALARVHQRDGAVRSSARPTASRMAACRASLLPSRNWACAACTCRSCASRSTVRRCRRCRARLRARRR